LEQCHQLLHLLDQLWTLILGYSLVWNIPDVAQCSVVGLFANVKPLLVPISERGVLGTAQVLLLHPILEHEVHSTGNFGAALGPLLPQAEQISKEVEMGLDSPYASQRWIKIETRKIELGCKLQIPIS
jgi:hypothetical protein